MIRLDADDWLDESAIFLLVTKLKQPSGSLVYGNYYYSDSEGRIRC